MCGICGIYQYNHLPVERNDLLRMAEILHHRGPDDSGVFCRQSVGIGHKRLSIVDLARGHQPMSNKDKMIWIVFNGEIYNHPQLKPLLEQKGYHYETSSDTETILHLYEEYGIDAVHKLRGMFAFAIWDSRKKLLFCARDRLGIKPFNYYADETCFIFASEIKAILEHPAVSRECNFSALPEKLFFGYSTDDQTMFKGVKTLLPGHYLTLSGDKFTIQSYWDVPPVNKDREVQPTQEALESLLKESIRIHLMSDVPIGVFLSGGVDSSLIAAMTQQELGDGLNTFSVGYKEAADSELPFARIVGKHLKTKHHEVFIDHNDFAEYLPKLIWHEDEPIVFPSSVPLYLVSKLAQKHVKVVLSGEGADEIFAGYPKYAFTLLNHRLQEKYESFCPAGIRDNMIRPLLKHLPLPLKYRKKFSHSFFFFSPEIDDIYINNFFSGFRPKEQLKILSDETKNRIGSIVPARGLLALFDKYQSDDFLSRILYMDQKTYLLELLMRQDAMSMATSIESRVPFLDHKVVECAVDISKSNKINGLKGKVILKMIADKYLPHEIVHRKKMGFPTPLAGWFRNEFSEHVDNLLLSPRTVERNIFQVDYVRHMLKQNREKKVDWTDQIWRLVNLELWFRIFIDQESSVSFSK